MGRKRCETTVKEQEQIFQWHKEGKSYSEIGQLIGRSKSTVQYIVKKIERDGVAINYKHKTGRRRILTQREERYLLKEVKKQPFISAPQLAKNILECFNKTVSAETCRRVLRRHNLHGRVARKKPFINKINKQKRLKFAKQYVNMNPEFWNQVIFSDESKFNCFGSDGRKFVWRKANTEMKLQHLKPTMKHGGGSVMIWGCMSSNGVGNLVFINGIMDKFKYLNILRENVASSARKLGLNDDFYFQHDNDPKHTAYVVRQWLLYNVPHRLHTPPQSPDLNPIENLWFELARRVQKCEVSSKETLKVKLEEAWNSIDPNFTRNLVRSMPRRLQAVIAAKGGPTKY